MTKEEMLRIAAEAGFTSAAVVKTSDIVFDASFRQYCAENLCGQYGANYSCPPDCGSPEEMREKITSYKQALVLQTVWNISDYSDLPAIQYAKGEHNAATQRLMQRMQSAGCDGLQVGASGCALCSPCAALTGEPCRYPQLRYSCMSAYCIYVRKLTDLCGMDYDCGPGRLGLFGLYVFD